MTWDPGGICHVWMCLRGEIQLPERRSALDEEADEVGWCGGLLGKPNPAAGWLTLAARGWGA